MAGKTTTLEYWWNWRVLLCGMWVLSSMMITSLIIWKYEGSEELGPQESQQQLSSATVYEDQAWRPCIKQIHPAWLLLFRVISFTLLFALLIAYVSIQGGQTFYFYTQWTFTLVVIYFALGSILSFYGCHKFLKRTNARYVGETRHDEERGSYVAPTYVASSTSTSIKPPVFQQEHELRPTAGIWGYVFQIIYQTNAGAVMLTDCVFWIIIVPFLEMKDYDLNLLMIGMHSINIVFLLVDTMVNSMRFPWFRISYFIMWTSIYVLFQWMVHACISIWWPYPFLDLSSHYSPIWYLLVALMHIPCYAIFYFIVKLKHWVLSRTFPQAYMS